MLRRQDRYTTQRAVGLAVLMAFGGLGWLTFLSPPLAHHLSPYNLASGLLGEGAVMVWLIVIGLSAQRWNELGTARRARPA
ncbi:MAG: hypothetical protein ACRD3Q_06160 [Terriglobales bacterium]